jgi:hypothetical protein
MELILARTESNEKQRKIKIEKIIEEVDAQGQKIYYFDKENSHKDIMALIETFESKSFNVYLRELKFGLADGEYMYEVHIL